MYSQEMLDRAFKTGKLPARFYYQLVKNPIEVLEEQRKTILEEYEKRQEEKDQKEIEKQIEEKIDTALDRLFDGFTAGRR